MTPEQATAVLVAITGLVAALGVLAVQLRSIHGMVNSRMEQLIQSTKIASQKTGELDGRDQERARSAGAPTPAREKTA